FLFFFFSSRRRHTRFSRDWSSDVCSSDLPPPQQIEVVLSGQNQFLGTNDQRFCSSLPWYFKERRWLLPHRQSGRLMFMNPPRSRSEERRVGKECRCRWTSQDEKKIHVE